MAVVVLAFAVLVLAFVVAALYRQVAVLTEGSAPTWQWPLNRVSPGQPLPPHSELPTDYSGFVALVDGRHDGYPAIVSIDALARAWDTPLVILARDLDDAVRWLDEIPLRRGEVFAASVEYMNSLGARSTVVVVHLREGRVTESAASGWSPARLAETFRMTAGPLYSATA